MDRGEAREAGSSLGRELKGLYDVARLARELGISRRAAEAICRQIPKQHVPELRKVYVRVLDLAGILAVGVGQLVEVSH